MCLPAHDRHGQPVHDCNLFSGFRKDFPDTGRGQACRDNAELPADERCFAAEALAKLFKTDVVHLGPRPSPSL